MHTNIIFLLIFVKLNILINKEESVDIRFGLVNAINTYLS